MQKIFIFIFVAGLVLYTASAILVKIDENRRFKKAKKFNDDKIIDRYMEENRKFSKNCKPSQYVFVICEIIGGIGYFLIMGYNGLIMQPTIASKLYLIFIIIVLLLLFAILILEQLYIIKEIF